MNNRHPYHWIRRLVMGVLFLSGFELLIGRCAKAAANPGVQLAVTAKTPASISTPPEPSHSYREYVFIADRYRDPFVPLNGEFRTDQSIMDRPPQVSSLVLKGIVQDAKGRMALLTSGISSYILKGGRLYDGRNRMVKKIAGVIKTDSVVIIGSDRTVRELKTKQSL